MSQRAQRALLAVVVGFLLLVILSYVGYRFSRSDDDAPVSLLKSAEHSSSSKSETKDLQGQPEGSVKSTSDREDFRDDLVSFRAEIKVSLDESNLNDHQRDALIKIIAAIDKMLVTKKIISRSDFTGFKEQLYALEISADTEASHEIAMLENLALARSSPETYYDLTDEELASLINDSETLKHAEFTVFKMLTAQYTTAGITRDHENELIDRLIKKLHEQWKRLKGDGSTKYKP